MSGWPVLPGCSIQPSQRACSLVLVQFVTNTRASAPSSTCKSVRVSDQFLACDSESAAFCNAAYRRELPRSRHAVSLTGTAPISAECPKTPFSLPTEVVNDKGRCRQQSRHGSPSMGSSESMTRHPENGWVQTLRRIAPQTASWECRPRSVRLVGHSYKALIPQSQRPRRWPEMAFSSTTTAGPVRLTQTKQHRRTTVAHKLP